LLKTGHIGLGSFQKVNKVFAFWGQSIAMETGTIKIVDMEL